MKRINIYRFDEAGAFSSVGIPNLNGVVVGAFGAGSAADELDELAEAVANDEEIYVDEEGVLHRANDVEGLNTVNTNTSNMTKVNREPFAGSAADELDELAEAVANDEEIYVDEEGVLHRANDVEGLNTVSTNTSNMTKVNKDPFAGINGNTFSERIASENEINNFGFPQTLSEQNIHDSEIIVQSKTTESNGDTLLQDASDGEIMMLDDSVLMMELDEEGVIQSVDDTMNTNTDREQESEVSGRNMTRISSKPFAAASVRKPVNPDQWYNRNPLLFKAEVANMRRYHPNATLGFLKATGNMYWLIETKIAKGVKPWHFVLEYEKDHPNNYSYGGSIHVQLLKSPSLEDLRTRARENGRKGVPHVVSATRANGESYNYLCTRRPEDVASGESLIASAVQVAGWAADWALHFETGMRSKEVWNKWCDDSHFRYLMIP